VRQDEDVLDTWFSSWLVPFSSLGWPERTPDLETFYPGDTLITAPEILFFWVARMIMAGVEFMGEVPFHTVYLHGTVRDTQHRKMSKSLGNGIDPLEVIERYGADALRYALARMASPDQQNLPLSEDAIEAGRNFANKIWNAARLILRAYPGGEPQLPPPERRTPAERWLLARHEACVRSVGDALDEYEISDAAIALHRFTWSEFCDWALEVEKPRLYEGSDDERSDAASVLAWVLDRTLRLLHPIMPFVTEEVWQRLAIGESIVIAAWPSPDAGADLETLGAREVEAFPFVQELVSAVRRFRTEHRIPPKAPLELRIVERGRDLRSLVEPFAADVRRLAGASSVSFVGPDAEASGAARLLVDGETVLVPIGDLFDVEAEVARLRSALVNLEQDEARSRGRLANDAFTTNAPPDVVEKERARLAKIEDEVAALREQIAQLENVGD
jgi:valyl-tRNA synthetase